MKTWRTRDEKHRHEAWIQEENMDFCVQAEGEQRGESIFGYLYLLKFFSLTITFLPLKENYD